MALWLVRAAGKHGEYEERFFSENRIYLTWDIIVDMTGGRRASDVRPHVVAVEAGASAAKVANHAGQIWAFLGRMKSGDLIATPRKHKASIAIGEPVGPCEYDAKADVHFRHSRRVRWLRTDVPRAVFDQDILYSFGAIQTICEVARNEAEKRVRAMISAGWKMKPSFSPPVSDEDDDGEARGVVDLQRTARDQIAQLIAQRFKGHELTHLIATVLQAKGFRTIVSPPGPDNGIDILAAPEPLGSGRPRICVQVKSSDAPVDRPTLDQLIGVMQNTQAEQGLLVSWGGFKQSVDKDGRS